MKLGLTEYNLVSTPGKDDAGGRGAGATPSREREFMVSAFYPALWAAPAAPALTAAHMLGAEPSSVLKKLLAPGLNPQDAVEVLKRIEAPFIPEATPLPWDEWENEHAVSRPSVKTGYPVLIYYPGGQGHRHCQWELCALLARAGVVVLALDTPGDAPFVTFPGGRVDVETQAGDDYIWPRVNDIRHLLDALPRLNAEGTLAGLLDLDRIACAGHSRGGYLANICAVEDARVGAAINMDGFLWGIWAEGTGLQHHAPAFQQRARHCAKPFLRLRADQQTWDQFAAGFELESADVAGDYVSADFPGTNHAWFGGHNWLCGERGKIPAPQPLSQNSEAPALLAPILTGFLRAVWNDKAVEVTALPLPGRWKARIQGQLFQAGSET